MFASLLPQWLLLSRATKTQPRAMQWSSTSYGPDGPWPAIQITAGSSPAQPIDLYPGGVNVTMVFSPSLCTSPEAKSTCYAKNAGLYDRTASKTGIEIADPAHPPTAMFSHTQSIFGSGVFDFDTMTLPKAGNGGVDFALTNASYLAIDRGYKSLPNGKNYSVQVGSLALGGPGEFFPLNGLRGNYAPAALFDAGLTPSYSFGMHIGSPSLNIPGSLYFGGYDQNRVIGTVSSQPVQNFLGSPLVDLLDISIGVPTQDASTSPFSYQQKTGLLSAGNSSLSPSLQISIEPMEPYLYLPDSTCRAIAAELPVTFSADLGLYLWDTKSAAYANIMASRSYMAFTFRLNDSISTNFEINVPFRLLNLTLTAPITDTPTPYFPCSLPTLDTHDTLPFRLGRAFLQAAFFGVNWGATSQGTWFLAQAPGPGLQQTPAVQSIQPSDQYVLSSSTDWLDTWPSNATNTTTGKTGSGNGSSGTSGQGSVTTGSPPSSNINIPMIVGIAAGVGGFLLIAMGVYLFFRLRSQRRRRTVELDSTRRYRGSRPAHEMAVSAEHYHARLGSLRQPKVAEAWDRPEPRMLDSKEVERWPPGAKYNMYELP